MMSPTSSRMVSLIERWKDLRRTTPTGVKRTTTEDAVNRAPSQLTPVVWTATMSIIREHYPLSASGNPSGGGRGGGAVLHEVGGGVEDVEQLAGGLAGADDAHTAVSGDVGRLHRLGFGVPDSGNHVVGDSFR